MSWVYSPAPEVGCSPPRISSAGARSAPSRSIPTVRAFWRSDSVTGCLILFRSGTISARSTGGRGAAGSTSFPVVSRARISAAPDAAQGSPESGADFGSKCSALLARCGLRMCSPKTRRTFALEGWASSSQGLPTWGLMLRGVCLELGTSVRPTDATACGSLLPTPTGAGNEGSPSMQKWPAHRALRMLPTPQASDHRGQASKHWTRKGHGPRLVPGLAVDRGYLPTPTATLYGSNQGGAAGRSGPKRQSLEGLTGGVLIALREWMMGWPLGWSASEPLATDRFREWLRSHGMCSPARSQERANG